MSTWHNTLSVDPCIAVDALRLARAERRTGGTAWVPMQWAAADRMLGDLDIPKMRFTDTSTMLLGYELVKREQPGVPVYLAFTQFDVRGRWPALVRGMTMDEYDLWVKNMI